jgi:hypothetical protein
MSLRTTVEAFVNGKVNRIASRQIDCARGSGPRLSYFFGYFPEENNSCAGIRSAATAIADDYARASVEK